MTHNPHLRPSKVKFVSTHTQIQLGLTPYSPAFGKIEIFIRESKNNVCVQSKLFKRLFISWKQLLNTCQRHRLLFVNYSHVSYVYWTRTVHKTLKSKPNYGLKYPPHKKHPLLGHIYNGQPPPCFLLNWGQQDNVTSQTCTTTLCIITVHWQPASRYVYLTEVI